MAKELLQVNLIGLGSHEHRVGDVDQPLLLPENAGKYEGARHNIGYGIVRAILQEAGLPPLQIESDAIQRNVQILDGRLQDQLYVATSTGRIEANSGQSMDATLLYAGPNLNGTNEALSTWL